jgi:hypothetical protein
MAITPCKKQFETQRTSTKSPASVRIIAAEVVAVWHWESSCKRWHEVIFSGEQLEEAGEP